MKVKIKKQDMKFALFGHGYHLCYMIEKLIKLGFSTPVVITHPKKLHERDRQLINDPKIYKYLFDVVKEYDIKILESEKTNCDDVYSFLKKHQSNVGFSISCRSIIHQDMINYFNGNIFNFHPSYLPYEKGGATFSWRILNNSKEVSATIHYIDKGIDTGNIVIQKKKTIEKKLPTPYDLLRQTTLLFHDLIDDFFINLDEIILSNGIIQPKDTGSYFPRLITEDNGAIDWTINGDLIERTIRAFSYPYPGAFTYLNGIKIKILSSRYLKEDHSLHPLMYGRIIDFLSSGTAKVVVKGGYILVDEIKELSGQFSKVNDLIKKPGQFHTPALEVESARCKNNPISNLEHL